MIDGIRNWIGDVASGKIKDAHIALTQAEALIFKRQLDESVSENTLLAHRVRELESENQELKAKLAAVEKNEEIDDQTYQILDALFDARDGLSANDIARSFQISDGVAEFHFDCLDGLGFIQKSSAYYGMGDPIPVSADISSEGRAYVMAARKRAQS